MRLIDFDGLLLYEVPEAHDRSSYKDGVHRDGLRACENSESRRPTIKQVPITQGPDPAPIVHTNDVLRSNPRVRRRLGGSQNLAWLEAQQQYVLSQFEIEIIWSARALWVLL